MIGDILQPTHLLFILVIALLVLGPKRLPEVGRSLGKGLRDFRTALSGDEQPDEAIEPAASIEPMSGTVHETTAAAPEPVVAVPTATDPQPHAN